LGFVNPKLKENEMKLKELTMVATLWSETPPLPADAAGSLPGYFAPRFRPESDSI
jgi:hypothetical protein